MTPPSAPLIRRKKKPQMPMKKTSGMIQPSRSGSHRFVSSPVYLTPRASSSSASFGSSTRVTVNWRLASLAAVGFSVPWIVVSPIDTSAIWPSRRFRLKSLYGIERPLGAR